MRATCCQTISLCLYVSVHKEMIWSIGKVHACTVRAVHSILCISTDVRWRPPLFPCTIHCVCLSHHSLWWSTLQSGLPKWLFLAACPCNPSGGFCDGYGGCICYPGYTGQYCEVLACRCNPSGGYCDYYYGNCICYPGYTGQYCDEMLGREKPCRQEGRTHSLVHGACLLLGSAVWTDRCHISLHSCIL